MEDPYDILGVKRGDSETAIRNAYRKMAKRHHPDLNPGKPEALDRFKAINAANDLLSDPEKRARFDRGEIDGDGNERRPERPTRRHPNAGRGAAGQTRTAGGFAPEDLADLFSQGFGTGGFNAGGFNAGRGPARGSDAQYSLAVDFLDAARGTVRRIGLPDGRTLDVTIPAGLRDGHVMRLKGQGNPGHNGGPPGDGLVEVSVSPHPFFRLVGDDIHLDLPVTLAEAVLGATVEVPTIKGAVRLTIPPHSTTGTKLRLKGRGFGNGTHVGAQVVEVKVMLPPGAEPDLAAFLRTWTPQTPFDPRAELMAPGDTQD